MTGVFDVAAYRISIQEIIEDGHRLLKGTVTELPDVAVFGSDETTVIGELREVISRLRDIASEHGKDFPEPFEQRDSSGRITLRVPKPLHAQMCEYAAADDVSLNTWIVAALGEKIGERRAGRQADQVIFTAASAAGKAASRVVEGGEAYT